MRVALDVTQGVIITPEEGKHLLNPPTHSFLTPYIFDEQLSCCKLCVTHEGEIRDRLDTVPNHPQVYKPVGKSEGKGRKAQQSIH